jgi:hypothetical protein
MHIQSRAFAVQGEAHFQTLHAESAKPAKKIWPQRHRDTEPIGPAAAEPFVFLPAVFAPAEPKLDDCEPSEGWRSAFNVFLCVSVSLC